jgi:hypothetical protein
MSEKLAGHAVDDSTNNIEEEITNSVSNPEIPNSIVRADLSPRDLGIGDTEIVFQRHGRYQRDENSPERGSLTAEAQSEEHESALQFFRQQVEAIPEGERGNFYLLVLASDTRYLGDPDAGMRSTETANIVLDAAKEILGEYGLSEDQILNISTNINGNGEARPTPILREPKILDESPEFIEFLKDKYERSTEYGEGSMFWQAFEGDWEKEKREEMGAEGPDEMADRLQKSLDILSRYSKFFHYKHPESRLVIWAASHYDTISPYAKRELMGLDKDTFLGVDYGSGITIKVSPSGEADTIINNKVYKVPIKN